MIEYLQFFEEIGGTGKDLYKIANNSLRINKNNLKEYKPKAHDQR